MGSLSEFSGDPSSDSDGRIVSWHWTFGDGESAAGRQVNHTYRISGVFNVTLAVTDDGGATNATSVPVEIAYQPFFDWSPESQYVQKPVLFTAHTAGQDVNVSKVEWDFGDSTKGEGNVVSHVFQRGGNHSVLLSVTNSMGVVFNHMANVTILLEVKIHLSKESPQAGEEITLRGEVVGAGNGREWGWSLGDETRPNGQTVRHAYAKAGAYRVSLAVKDSNNAFGFTALDISVLHVPVCVQLSSNYYRTVWVAVDATDRAVNNPAKVYESTVPEDGFVYREWSPGDWSKEYLIVTSVYRSYSDLQQDNYLGTDSGWATFSDGDGLDVSVSSDGSVTATRIPQSIRGSEPCE